MLYFDSKALGLCVENRSFYRWGSKRAWALDSCGCCGIPWFVETTPALFTA